MMEEHPFLSVLGLSKTYGPTPVLREIGFSLERGSVLGLFGPNGSGKSTLLNILALASAPAAGIIRMDGEDTAASPLRFRRRIGYVPQEIALFEELTVEENLLCWSRLPRKAAKIQAAQLAGELALTQLLGKRVVTLSGGMKRRVNLAVALLAAPELLILDEPLAGVDAENGESILQLLAGRKAEGVTQIISEHSPGQVMPLIDRVLVLSGGNMRFYGDREHFLAQSPDGHPDRALKNILRG